MGTLFYKQIYTKMAPKKKMRRDYEAPRPRPPKWRGLGKDEAAEDEEEDHHWEDHDDHEEGQDFPTEFHCPTNRWIWKLAHNEEEHWEWFDGIEWHFPFDWC